MNEEGMTESVPLLIDLGIYQLKKERHSQMLGTLW